MKMQPIKLDISKFPQEFHSILNGSQIFDSSCSSQAKVYFVDNSCGYFIKTAKKGVLEREALMTRFFNRFGFSAKPIAYVSNEQDYLVTEKITGDDCITDKYLRQPQRLCDKIAESLIILHSLDILDCPISHTGIYLQTAEQSYISNSYNKEHFPDSFGYTSAQEAWGVVQSRKRLLKSDTLLHGDYCLPNIILNNWKLSGFVDLSNSGVGDRHVDIFWALWSLAFNLKTNKFRERFFDAYGHNKIDEEMLRLIAAIEVFDD